MKILLRDGQARLAKRVQYRRAMTPRHALELVSDAVTGESAIVDVWVFAPGPDGAGPIDRNSLLEWIGDRISRSRALTERVEFHRWPADPNWIRDVDPQWEQQVNYVDVAGENWDGLRRRFAAVLAEPMDLSRPPWELHVLSGAKGIDGFPDGSTFVVLKFHHCVGDGIETVAIARRLFDDPDGEAEPADPDVLSGPPLLVQTAAVPARFVRMLRAWRRARTAVAEFEDLVASEEITPAPVAPRTRFNGPLTGRTTADVLRWDLRAVQEARRKVPGATLNDFVLAVVAGGLRGYLERHGELPEEPLVGAIPMSVVATAERLRAPERGSNQFSMVLLSLSTDEPDPLVRFRSIVSASAAGKARARTTAAVTATTALDDYPWWVAKRIVAAHQRRVSAGARVVANTTVANVPRGPGGLMCCGAQAVSAFGVLAVHGGGGLGHIVTSFGDELALTFTADESMMPDPDAYRDDLLASYDALVTAIDGSSRGDPPRNRISV